MTVKVKYNVTKYATVEIDDKYKKILIEDKFFENELIDAIENKIDNIETNNYMINEVYTTDDFMLYEYY